MELLTDQPLDSKNTLGLPARAGHFCRVGSVEDLSQALDLARQKDLDVLILGGGSNLVFTRDWSGLVVQMALPGVEELDRSADAITIRVAAGQDWPGLVESCLGAGWYGLENLALIPGTAGAAPVQNIGAYGVELSDRLEAVEALELTTGAQVELGRAECGFGYRESIFKGEAKGRYVITAIRLRLDLVPRVVVTYKALADLLTEQGHGEPTPAQVFGTVCKLRQAKLPDPAVLPNAGSFFKNPLVDGPRFKGIKARFPELVAFPQAGGEHKLAAGWLIDRCGLKGLRQGAVGIHEHQALVLVNHGGATGRELMDLADHIQDKVHDTFGVRLEIEPRVI